jgi:lauroyl/myristoyl acyltransferase
MTNPDPVPDVAPVAFDVPTDLNLARRIYASPLAHRMLPWPVAVATVRARAARIWAQSTVKREHAIRSMEFVVGTTDWAGEVEQLAKRWIFESLKRDELTWRAWQTTRFEVEGTEIFDLARRQGRGAILSFFHHGQHGGLFGSLARRGVITHVAVLPSLIGGDPGPGYQGLRRKQHIATARTGGAVMFAAKGGMDHMREMLNEGKVVALASDLPGSLPFTMLGRRVSGGSGAARLAAELDVPLIPVTAWQRGTLQSYKVGTPIEPGECDGLEGIQQAIADAHAPAIMAWPEGLMAPFERWRAVDPADIERYGVAPTIT